MHSRLAEVAKEYGMTIACESLRPQETRIGYRIDQIKRLFDTVNHPNFKVMIDLTAMCVQGETVQRWFDTFGAENIIHSHFRIATRMAIMCGAMASRTCTTCCAHFWITATRACSARS